MKHRLTNAALIAAAIACTIVYTVGASALWLYVKLTRRGTPS